jgi:hypothetical protein
MLQLAVHLATHLHWISLDLVGPDLRHEVLHGHATTVPVNDAIGSMLFRYLCLFLQNSLLPYPNAPMRTQSPAHLRLGTDGTSSGEGF